jgi:DNA-directed RNA polymerase subunit L
MFRRTTTTTSKHPTTSAANIQILLKDLNDAKDLFMRTIKSLETELDSLKGNEEIFWDGGIFDKKNTCLI